MKSEALFFVAPGKVEPMEIDIPEPLPNQVQIEIKACGICMADLYNFTHGEALSYPFSAGHEGVGVARKVGWLVEGIHTAELVAGEGSRNTQTLTSS